MVRLLHAGCGGDPLPPWLGECIETRLDIDASHAPDIVASMTQMGEIGEYDMVWCSHALEHLTAADAEKALTEFRRVLRPGGCAVVVVPDLEDVKPTEDVLYDSPAGPITGRDMYYGHSASLGNPFMQHKNGFIASTLHDAMSRAGFATVEARRIRDYNLAGIATK